MTNINQSKLQKKMYLTFLLMYLYNDQYTLILPIANKNKKNK